MMKLTEAHFHNIPLSIIIISFYLLSPPQGHRRNIFWLPSTQPNQAFHTSLNFSLVTTMASQTRWRSFNSTKEHFEQGTYDKPAAYRTYPAAGLKSVGSEYGGTAQRNVQQHRRDQHPHFRREVAGESRRCAQTTEVARQVHSARKNHWEGRLD